MKSLWMGVLGIAVSTLVQAEEGLEITITSGTRMEHPSVNVPARIQVIQRDEIERSQARTVADVLRGRAGLQVTDLRGDGGDTNIGLRGFSETSNANVLILVDGRRLNYADTRSPDLSHIPLGDIERIEITQGSAGTLFGHQAVGGVVNIITRGSFRDRSEVDVALGDYNRSQGRLFLTRRHGDFSYKLAAEALESDGYRDHSARSFSNLSTQLNYRLPDGNAFVEYQYTEDDLELPGAIVQSEYDVDRRQINSGFANDFSNSDINVLRLGLRHGLSKHWRFEGEWTRRTTSQRLTQSFRNNASPTGGFGERNANSFNPRFIGNYQMAAGKLALTLGADIESNYYRAYIPNAFGATNRWNKQDTSAVYGQAVIPLQESLSLTTGARRANVLNDMWDATNFKTGQIVKDSLSVATLGLNLQISPSLRAYARRDENFRFAKVDELTGAAAGNILNTQTGVSLETGVSWQGQDWNLDVGLYRLDLENEIYFNPNTFQNINLDKTQRKGVTISALYQLSKVLDLSMDYTYIDAVFKDGPQLGKKVSSVSPNLLTLRTRYRRGERWNWDTELQLVSGKYPSGDNLNRTQKLPGYGVVNTALQYEHHNWLYKFSVNNLLDKEYNEFVTDSGFGRGYNPSPERNVMLNIRYKF